MNRSFVCTAVVASFLAAPASAANWVTILNGIRWIDTASCEVKYALTYCADAVSKEKDVAPDVGGTLMGNTPEIDIAVNCATGEVFDRRTTNFDEWAASNYTVPKQYEWVKSEETNEKVTQEIVRVVCDR